MYDPAAHGPQSPSDCIPEPLWYAPAEHAVHCALLDAPVLLRYVPAPHWPHADPPLPVA